MDQSGTGGGTRTTIRQAVILAGGLGTRLGALTAQTAKPVLEVGGRPFLFWPMRELQRFGVERFLILTGHGAAAAEQAVRDLASGLPRPAEVEFSREPAPLGTGGALLHAGPLLDERFLLLNGDTLFDGNLAVLLAAAAAQPAAIEGHLLLRTVADTSRFGVVTTDGAQVTSFGGHAEPDGGAGTVSTGIAVLDRRVLRRLRPGGSLERDVLPGLAEAGLLHGTVAEGWCVDIGTPGDLARARAALPGRLQRRALFLDRDGVLNVDHGYVGSRDRWEWMPGAREAVALATGRGWHVFVVTNQSGIARGLYDEPALFALHEWVGDALRAAGGTVDDWRHCPFHPEASLPRWRRASDWRKPGPGMLLDLLRAWSLDPARCLMLGDQPSDLAAAAAAGVAGHRFAGGRLDWAVAALLDAAGAG